MVPHLTTAHTRPPLALEATCDSVDLRNSGFKLALVETEELIAASA